MNSPTDDDPDLGGILELFAAEEIALFDARAQVAWHERTLADLAKAHPEAAALRSNVSKFTAADLRTDELKDPLGRINAALKLTGDEEDYWLQLWDFARANLGLTEDQFDDMTREQLAGIVDAGLPEILAKQQRNQWSRSRRPGTETLYARVRELKKEGHSQLEMCVRLDANNSKLPDLVAWRDLTWRAAYLSPKYNGSVKKWLSKIKPVTP